MNQGVELAINSKKFLIMCFGCSLYEKTARYKMPGAIRNGSIYLLAKSRPNKNPSVKLLKAVSGFFLIIMEKIIIIKVMVIITF